MLDYKIQLGEHLNSEIDLAVAGAASAPIDVRAADYAGCGATLHTGEWTDGVLTVYGSIDKSGWVSTGETIIASRRAAQNAVDCVRWAWLRYVVTTPDTGAGGVVRPCIIQKGPLS